MPRTDGTQLRLLLAAVVQNALGFCLSRTRGNVPALSRATEPADLDDEQLLDLITEQGSALCRKYGGLRAALECSDVDLARDGAGASERTFLHAALEIGQRFTTATINRGAFLTSTAQYRNAIMARLRDRKHEVCTILFLTNRHQVIPYEEMFRGTRDGSRVYPREVTVRCLEVNAAAIIMAHNHPSGVAQPTATDRNRPQPTARSRHGWSRHSSSSRYECLISS